MSFSKVPFIVERYEFDRWLRQLLLILVNKEYVAMILHADSKDMMFYIIHRKKLEVNVWFGKRFIKHEQFRLYVAFLL